MNFKLIRFYFLIALVFVCTLSKAQDLDSRVLQIKALDLANEPDIFSEEYNFVYSGSFPLTPLDFNKKEVFWEPVDMGQAVAKENREKNRTANVRPIQVKSFGFSTTSQYQADGQTKVNNIVYRDMRGMQLLDPCPPVGICWRCASSRTNGAFRQP